jgi:hypothetical protein
MRWPHGSGLDLPFHQILHRCVAMGSFAIMLSTGLIRFPFAVGLFFRIMETGALHDILCLELV